MEQNNCQRCKESFDLAQRIPKKLNCGCIVCAKCINAGLEYDDQFVCKAHKQVFKGQVSELKDFIPTEGFEQQISNFEQEAKLSENMQKFSQIFKAQQMKYFEYKKNILMIQNFFSNIVQQVCHQATNETCEQIKSSLIQSSNILSNLKSAIKNVELMKHLPYETRQQQEERVELLNQVLQKYEKTKQEILNYNQFETEEKDINQFTDYLRENCFNQLKAIQSKIQTEIPQQQNVNNLVNEYLNKKEQYEFTILTSENVSKFIEQFQTEVISGPKMKENPLNNSNICFNYDILSQFKQQQSLSLLQKLNEVIVLSKNYKEIEQASANSITILKHFNNNFTQKNYEGIRIRGADLSDSIFQDCNLKNANMVEVNLRNAQLTNCNLNGVNFTNAQLEPPQSLDTLKGHTYQIQTVALSSDQK